jgi:hypothetical protein
MPEVIARTLAGPAPATYTLPGAQDLTISAVTALFDGSSAAGSFLPCLSLYAQSGALLARVFPSQLLEVGDTARVSYAPAISGYPTQLGSATTYHVVSAASTNAASVKAAPAFLSGYMVGNPTTAFSYVKLYDTAGTPTAGSGTPLVVLAIPASSSANVLIAPAVEFKTGLGITIVAGIADSDATAVAANSVVVTLYYQ